MTNISLWDLLSIREQNNQLKEALVEVERPANKNVASSSQANEETFATPTTQSCLPTVLTNEATLPRSQVEGKPKQNPFYLTLMVGDKILHNSLIDSDASTTIMPKKIVKVLNIKYKPLSSGFMQLDGNKV